MKYLFNFGKYIASWNDIGRFYNNDKILAIRTAPKLTEKHLHQNGFTKIEVNLATQIFSHTVSAAIFSYASMGSLPPGAFGTGELLHNKLQRSWNVLLVNQVLTKVL